MKKRIPVGKKTRKRAKVAHPGMMGDGTEEQNLGQSGNPAARIKRKEVVAAFDKRRGRRWSQRIPRSHAFPINCKLAD
jgi:hypothetical protein